jgi:HAD superfamily, subfamily IIIB (Acid phosphatase)
MGTLSAHRRIRTLILFVSALVVTALIAGGATGAIAFRHAHAVPPPPAQPTSADQIQNLDQVKTAIKAYYGDTISGTNPDGSPQHLPSPNGAYAHEVGGIERFASFYLARRAHHQRHLQGRPAIVLDVDDTSLNTYNYEIFSNFVYNPATNATFVNGAAFPAVFGMPRLANRAADEGYTVFFLTGRPESQRAGTTTNLTNVGFDTPPADHLFLKDLSAPWLSSCAPSCTTIQYKSLTRAHIESLGYEIVANFGDQFSDLLGGHADRTVKMPNPMYFLP